MKLNINSDVEEEINNKMANQRNNFISDEKIKIEIQ